MSKRFDRIARRTYPWLCAGFLLQAGGCSIDFNQLLAGLATSIVTSFITDLVFGAFGLGFGF